MSGMTFSTESPKNSYLSSIQLTQDLLNNLLLRSQAISQFLTTKEYVWNREITEITNQISLFVEITTLLTKISQKQGLVLTEARDSHVHLLFILKGMNQAQSKLDLVALEELIKYELKDNLTQWKIDLIPQIKKTLSA